ncbi:MAG: protoporphyrinogen oxidase [Actinomycetales bacterium]|nr:protoporphyrinogen oxidase [Actinomycetales bacterium]
MPSSIVIVGAGPAGLATATFLRWQLGPETAITVLDARAEAGGKVRTPLLAGLPVDTGPDSLLARGAELRELIDGLGLTDQIVEPMPGGAFIWSRGRLRPIPPGATFGLPERLLPVLRSGLLSPAGTLRAGLDVVLPRTALPGDPSVGELVRPRFGSEVYDRMVEPLLGGVHAGSPDLLSAGSTVPEIAAMARTGRSMILTMRDRRRAAPKPPDSKRPAALVSLRGGLSRLTQAMVSEIGADSLRLGSAATGLAREADGRWTVTTPAGSHTADIVVVATPAYTAADLLEPLSVEAAGILRETPYVDVANVTLAYRPAELPQALTGTGFLVPPVEGAFIVGCTWLTSKWPHLANEDVVLIKCMVGRWGDNRWLPMDDAELEGRVRADLATIMGVVAEPFDRLVQRWPGAMPQYTVGHSARMDRLDALVEPLDGLLLTGSAYRGSGLAACATQAKATAARIAAR